MSGIARRSTAAARNIARRFGSLGVALAAVVAAAASPAGAMTIKATFDPSVTSLSNAAQIESDFNTVAKFYDSALTSKVTVNVDVGWGAIDGQSMGPGNLGSSLDNLYGYFSYDQVKGYLTAAGAKSGNAALAKAVKSLPASDPGGVNAYVIPSAQAKALGLIPATQAGPDGYIGFSSSQAYDFDPSNGITSTTYDFEGVAAHEIAEVLGRITGLTGSNPQFRTSLDLFRYSAAGQLGYAFKSPAYFSIDGGVTDLGDFSYNSGDRSDWLVAGVGATDAQAATAKKGVDYSVSVADLTALDALGWGGTNLGDTKMWTPTMIARSFMGVPEPGAWGMMLLGAAALGAQLRRRRAFLFAA